MLKPCLNSYFSSPCPRCVLCAVVQNNNMYTYTLVCQNGSKWVKMCQNSQNVRKIRNDGILLLPNVGRTVNAYQGRVTEHPPIIFLFTKNKFMNKQKGFLRISKGSIGETTFEKTRDGYRAEEKLEGSAGRCKPDPACASIRENPSEFGRPGPTGKVTRNAITSILKDLP